MSNDKSIEFQDIKNDNAQPSIVRRSFRVPVNPDDGIKAVINGTDYKVMDISVEGISIACGVDTAFMVEQAFDNCELLTPDGVIKPLTGRVIHFSCDSGKKNRQNGILWVDLTEDTSQKISTLVVSMKNRLLKIDTSSK